MEVIFLLVGLGFIAVGIAIAVSEIRARMGTQCVNGRVIGFSTGRRNKPTSPSFHSVVQFIGPDGGTYYVEGAIGSSAPLHAVGDSMDVLVSPSDPHRAVVKSALSYVLAGVIGFMGLVSVMVFKFTFRPNLYSLVMAAVVLAGFSVKIKNAWRKQPLSMAAWQEYKRQIFGPKVFTEQTRDQISWADPISITVAVKHYEKSNRFAVPILFALGLLALFFGHHVYVRTHAFIEKADQAAGRVVSLEQKEPTASDDGTTYAAVVEFQDARGQAHRFADSFSASSPLYDFGETVEVLYDPANPSEAQIDRGRWNYWGSILLYGVGALFVLLGAHTFSKRRTRTAWSRGLVP